MGYKDLQSQLAMPPTEGMAMIRTASPVPDTYVNLAKMLFSKLPAGYSRIDIVADPYRLNSLKEKTEYFKQSTY